MERSLHQRFSEAESAFLDALNVGEDELTAFAQDWASLRDDFEAALAQGVVDPDTASYAHVVSYQISEISESFLKLETTCEELTASLMADLASISERNQSPSIDSQQETTTTRRNISLAAEWMSRNYHNPYPSNSVRDNISRQAKWNRKDVDVWFTEARRRIGWNDIRRQFFDNKRAEAVEKATQFFNDPRTSTDPALAQAFIDMESRVRDLYVDPFKPSGLAIALDKAYRDSAPGTRQVTAYSPSSTPSRSVSSEPLPLSPVSRSVSPVRLSQKRRRRKTTEDNIDVVNPRKRPRQEHSVTFLNGQTQLPSPAASELDLTEKTPEVVTREVSDCNTQLMRSPSPTPLPNAKRRRMSHSDTHPKYPSAGPRATRLQTVSAPLPSPSRSQSPASPPAVANIPGMPDTPNFHLISTSSMVTQPPASASAVPHVEPVSTHVPLSQAEIPSFSFEIPGPATCDQPTAAQAIDLAFFDSSASRGPQSCASTFDASALPNTPSLLGTMSQVVPSIEGVDIDPLSGLFNTLDGDQLLGLLPSPFDQNAIAMPSVQPNTLPDLTEVDINFSPFFDFDASTSLEPQMDDLFFTNFLGHIPIPSAPSVEDINRAKQMAHLEALKEHRNHLQERIRSLERQIAGKLV